VVLEVRLKNPAWLNYVDTVVLLFCWMKLNLKWFQIC